MSTLRRRFLPILLLVVWLPAGALALTGQTYSTFETYYKEDVSFINANTGRHMLPRDLSRMDLSDSGRVQYTYYDEALNVTIAVDAAGIIETCEIRLLIPEGMVYGNSLYLDFVNAGYHSYAFIMAMHMSSEVSGRYLLVQEISRALEDNSGFYERQLGSYTVTCTRVIGEGAVFTFTNNGLAPAATDAPSGEPTPEEAPAEITEDEAANYG